MSPLVPLGAALLARLSLAPAAEPETTDPVTPFVEAGTRELARVAADLDKDGDEDVVLVLEKQKARPSDPDVFEQRRPLLVLTRQADGSLRLAKRNEDLVCSDCDFNSDQLTAEPGRFAVAEPVHYPPWSVLQYSFGYSRRDKTWQLVGVEHKAPNVDGEAEWEAVEDWAPPRHFGKIDIADFDRDNWKGQGEGYPGLPTPMGPIRKLAADCRTLPEGADLELLLQEAADALDDLHRASNVEARNALEAFIDRVKAAGSPAAAGEAPRLVAAADQIVGQLRTDAAGAPPPATATYRSEKDGFEFRHPGRWIVGDCHPVDQPRGSSCVAVYRRRADVGTEGYVAELESVPFALEAAATHAGIDFSQASDVASSNWKGIEVEQACPVSDWKTGYHAAAGDCLTAVLSRGGRSVVVNTPGYPRPGAELRALIESVTFLEPRK